MMQLNDRQNEPDLNDEILPWKGRLWRRTKRGMMKDHVCIRCRRIIYKGQYAYVSVYHHGHRYGRLCDLCASRLAGIRKVI